MFHSKVTIGGCSVPDDKPVLFVPNHQNAFLDALHLVTATPKFVHFLTRAKPFGNPFLNWFFRSLNMLPVYRVRNGFSAIKKNEAIFDECAKRLSQNDAVLVFAEASQAQKRRVRPFSKGFTRIAFGAEEKYNWELDLQVVPVGISYSDHKKARSKVHLEFGKCIPVRDFRERYLADERAAAHELKEKTEERLKQLTMHIPDLDNYRLYELLLDDLERDRALLLKPHQINDRVKILMQHASSEMIDRAEKLLEEMENSVADLHDFVDSNKIGVRDLVLSPIYLFSWINNIIPFQAVRWVIEKYLQDHSFDASAKYLMGLFGLPLFYLAIGAVIGSAGAPSYIIITYLLLSVLTAPQFVRAKDLLEKSSVDRLENENPDKAKTIRNKVDSFLALREKLFDKE